MLCKGCVYYDEWTEDFGSMLTRYCNLNNERNPKKCDKYRTDTPVVQEDDDDPEWRY